MDICLCCHSVGFLVFIWITKVLAYGVEIVLDIWSLRLFNQFLFVKQIGIPLFKKPPKCKGTEEDLKLKQNHLSNLLFANKVNVMIRVMKK